jgi:hypothetical protein
MTPTEAIAKLDLIVRCLKRATPSDEVRTALKAALELQEETHKQYDDRPTGGEWKKDATGFKKEASFQKTGDAAPAAVVKPEPVPVPTAVPTEVAEQTASENDETKE